MLKQRILKMQRKEFQSFISGGRIDLRHPAPTMDRARALFDMLQRNDFFYPKRLSLINLKSPDDCLKFIQKRILAIENMTDNYYDIFVRRQYIGEIYARDFDYDSNIVKNLGYFIDKKSQGMGYATEAVSILTDYLFDNGVHRVCLFSHFFDDNEINLASERVAKKCGFEFEGIARDSIYDKLNNRYASERMFAKLRRR